jgi:hypothetical protein
LLMTSVHSFLPTPPRNTTTTTFKHQKTRSGRSQPHAQQVRDAAISIQVIMRPWCTSRAGGGEDFAALRSQGLRLPGQRKYTLQYANSRISIAEKIGFAAFGVVVGAASIYTMVRLDRASGPAPMAAETATKSSTTVRLHTVGDYLVSTITHPYSFISMPLREHHWLTASQVPVEEVRVRPAAAPASKPAPPPEPKGTDKDASDHVGKRFERWAEHPANSWGWWSWVVLEWLFLGMLLPTRFPQNLPYWLCRI